MDPLSVTASIIALIGCCRQLQKGLAILRQLSSIPEEVASLADEVNDFRNVLAAISVVTKQRLDVGGLAECSDDLHSLLVKAAELVNSIGNYCGIPIDKGQVQEVVELDGLGVEIVNPPVNLDLLTRFRWIKDKKSLEAKRRRLKSIKFDLSNHLHSLSLADSCSVLTELRDLATVFRKLSVDREAVQTLVASLQNNSQEQGSNAGEDDSTQISPPTYDRGTYRSEMISKDATDCQSSSDSDGELQLSHCSCSCHKVTSYKSPQALGSIFGTLTIRSSGGADGTKPACDEVSCTRRKRSSVRFTYRFPSWLLNRSINTLFSAGATAGPQLNLALTRVIPPNSDIFCFAMQGNIAGVKNLFSKGLASPFDITHNYGYSALHYATDYGHRELVNFLLKIGARAEIEDYSGRTSTDLAYHGLCNPSAPEGHGNRLWELFDQDSWLEEKQFSTLHKLVLGLVRTKKQLRDELSISTKGINTTDATGRTPLSWAAERGDSPAVQTLLEFGADSSLPDKDRNTPLHYACKAEHPSALRLLCAHGVSPIARNAWGQTPLNWASFYSDDPEFARTLLAQPGVTLDDVDNSGSSPVGNAAFSSHAHMLTFLLSAGADVNHVADRHGTNPLLDCVSNNAHASFGILLAHAASCGLNLAHRDRAGEGLLHHLARRGDARLIAIFADAVRRDVLDVAGLSLTSVGEAGLTPSDLLMLRGDAEVQAALEEALVLIARENECGKSVESLESVDTGRYADAFELLPVLEKSVGVAVLA